MDIRQQCLDSSKSYSFSRANITHLRHDRKVRIIYLSTKPLPDDGFASEHHSIELPCIYEPHGDPSLHSSDNDSSDTEADSHNQCIDPAQPPVQAPIYGTPHLDNRLPSKPISTSYFDILEVEKDRLSPYCCEEDYRSAHRCVKHNFSRAAINELFRNPTMSTISNFTLPHTLFTNVEHNVLLNGHRLFEIEQRVLQFFGRSSQPSR